MRAFNSKICLIHSLDFKCATTNSVPGENVIEKRKLKANKEPDRKMRRQYAGKNFTA